MQNPVSDIADRLRTPYFSEMAKKYGEGLQLFERFLWWADKQGDFFMAFSLSIKESLPKLKGLGEQSAHFCSLCNVTSGVGACVEIVAAQMQEVADDYETGQQDTSALCEPMFAYLKSSREELAKVIVGVAPSD